MDEFCKKYLGKRIGLLGLGSSGISAIKYFNKNVFDIIIWDDSPDVRKSKVFSSNNISNLNLNKNIKSIDILFVSPGIPFNHQAIRLARKWGKPIISDIDIFWNREILNNNLFIGITGSNGKSTVTSLIYHILSSSDSSVKMAGNIGIPVLELKTFKKRGIFVLELSSYQLNLATEFKASISLLLNISPDHLENHGSLDNYILSKEKIFNNQTEKDIAIINIDNYYCRQIHKRLINKKNPPKIITVSLSKKMKNGVFYKGDVLVDYTGEQEIEIGKISNLTLLRGEHNRENIAHAVAACLAISISRKNIKDSLPTYSGLPHRMEEISTFQNIKFINDSKSTNLISSIVAMKCFPKIIWIAGGLDKKENLDQVKKVSKHILAGFFIGTSGKKFKNFYKKYFQAENSVSLDKAVNSAVNFALNLKDSVVILFSPGCASFDQYKNFEFRGKAFKNEVNKSIKKIRKIY